jgi:hypothetical protein
MKNPDVLSAGETRGFFFRSAQFRVNAMELEQSRPEGNVQQNRDRLPNRRACQTIAFERDGSNYQMTVGFYPDGRPGEVFLNADRSNSLLDVLASDAAILASLALQFGAPLETIRHALKRNSSGETSSPIGAALDRIMP